MKLRPFITVIFIVDVNDVNDVCYYFLYEIIPVFCNLKQYPFTIFIHLGPRPNLRLNKLTNA